MIYRLREPLALAAEPHFDRALVVIQSDDWGQPCATDRATLERAWPAAAAPDAPPWALDTRESADDVRALAEQLAQHRDARGRPACATLNLIVRRPNFDAIASAGFAHYCSLRLGPADAAFAAALEGERAGTYELALHGGEHVAPARWLRLLREGDATLRAFFDVGVMPPPALISCHPGLGAACLACPDEAEPDDRLQRLRDALDSFAALCGRPATGFVAPNHAWDDAVETTLAQAGVRHLQASHVCYGNWALAEQGAWTARAVGPAAHAPLWYQTRSIDFEPAVRPADCAAAIVRACLLARRGIPVVINTHRINYASGIHPGRAAASRQALGRLIRALCAARPDLWFLSSGEFDAVLRGQGDGPRRLRLAPLRGLALDVGRAALGRPPGGARG